MTPQARTLRYKESSRRNSKAQLDDDLIATQLAQLGSRERLYDTDRLCTHGMGRIVVQFDIDENHDQWRDVHTRMGKVFVLGGYSEYIFRFDTPCTYSPPRHDSIEREFAERKEQMILWIRT